MVAVFTDDQPLFLQLADRIADDILSGTYPEETAVPSATDLGVFFGLNPATVSKGVNLLVALGALYKKRGVGMFVAVGAGELLRQRRRTAFEDAFVVPLIAEARVLGIDVDVLHHMITARAAEETP